MTFIHKFIIPVFPIGLAIVISYIIDNGPFIPDSVPMLIFFSIPSIFIYFQTKNLKKVEFDDSRLIVSNFRNRVIYDLKDIVDVKRTIFDYYKITIKTEKEYKVIKLLPSFHERMLNLFGNTKSISDLINKVTNLKEDEYSEE